MKIKTYIITIFFIIISLTIFSLFPIADSFQKIIAMSVFLVVIPVVFNKIILRKKIKDIGLQIGNWRQGLIWSAISAIIMLLVYIFLGYFLDFFKNYSLPSSIVGNFWEFISYELFSALFIIFIYEFFFRGFVMMILSLKIGCWAIAVQTLLFLILAIIIRSTIWVPISYVIFAPFGGVIAYKSKSIIYSGALHFITNVILNAFVVRLLLKS